MIFFIRKVGFVESDLYTITVTAGNNLGDGVIEAEDPSINRS